MHTYTEGGSPMLMLWTYLVNRKQTLCRHRIEWQDHWWLTTTEQALSPSSVAMLSIRSANFFKLNEEWIPVFNLVFQETCSRIIIFQMKWFAPLTKNAFNAWIGGFWDHAPWEINVFYILQFVVLYILTLYATVYITIVSLSVSISAITGHNILSKATKAIKKTTT